jgi:phosphoglycerol transferase
VPLGLLAVWLVAQSRRLEWRSPGALVCIGVALAFGVSNPYNLLFWGQLLVWALIVQWYGVRRRANLTIGLTAGAIAVAAFLITNAEIWIHVQEPEGLPLLTRNYGGTERYALKPMEMFIPSQFHRWDWLAFFGHRYSRWAEWRGEPYLPYLGIFGIVGLVWLVAVSVRRLMARQAPPGQALSAGWLLAYSTVGGLTNVVAFFFGMQIFRATNRVAIFISALVLAFLVVRLSRFTAQWPDRWRLTAALGVAAIGLSDQLPVRWPDEVYARMNADARSDRELGRKLEEALPKGAMVFQLPVLGFPEVVPPHRLADYEHFRLYLNTQDLRFSYGAAKNRSRSRWQMDLENVPVETLVRRLESYGFAALYINRKGFEDNAEKMLQELDRLGYARRLQGGVGNQVVVLLNPKPEPVLPLGRALTYGRGWHPRSDSGVRWAGDRAALSYFNPNPQPLQAQLTLQLVAASPREVILELNGRVLRRVTTSDQSVSLDVSDLTLEPGISRLVLRSTEPAQRQGSGRYQLRAFGLKDITFRITPGPLAGDWSD